MTITEKMARLERIRGLIKQIRACGSDPNVAQALELIVALLERDIGP